MGEGIQKIMVKRKGYNMDKRVKWTRGLTLQRSQKEKGNIC